jgi:long-chain acyl-CoA synthetase
MSPITTVILQHPAEKIALVVDDQRMTYGELALAMNQAGLGRQTPDSLLTPSELTFDSNRPVIHAVIKALQQLHRGQAIVGSTSGSTGAAKFYERSQASWVASFQADQNEFGLTANDVIVAPGSLAHSLFSYAVCHGLFIGATVVLSEAFRPDRVLQQIQKHQATVLYAVPTQLKLLVSAAEIVSAKAHASSNAWPSVRWVLSSGSRWFSELTAGLTQRFPNAVLGEFYGASELSFVSVAKHGKDTALPAGSVGRPFSGVNVDIVDGRIWVNSEGLFTRYHSANPPDFFERVDAEGKRWLSVGDHGFLDGNGYLFLSGRESRKLIVSGKNLYPEEIEEALESHPWVQRAAVLGQFDDQRGERLLAVVQLTQPSDEALRKILVDHLRPLLEDFKIPRDYRSLTDWPTTATGKTDFAAIRKVIG